MGQLTPLTRAVRLEALSFTRRGAAWLRASTPLTLIGLMFTLVGSGNLWVGHTKMAYYQTAYSRAVDKGASLRTSIPFTELGIHNAPSQHAASIAARRALTRLDYYWLVACCGYLLVISGGVMVVVGRRSMDGDRE
jgi:hypothetical protein